MSASYELARNRIGNASDMVGKACELVGKKTGALCHTVKARILFVQKDKHGRCDALRRALEYEPDNVVLRHQFGVALSMAGEPEKAIAQFDEIIETERKRTIPRDSLLLALKTRMINLQRLSRDDEVAECFVEATRIMNDHPHLAAHKADFAEFDAKEDEQSPL